TYIRTLARDIARKLGTAGYVNTLVRTRVGDYHLADAMTIEAVQAAMKSTEVSQ
ncbi:MAG: tRNA pseudouridine(55) synthase, partial [Calditrichaeota bacterium]|nr:tRNA pseudouridine(55) synthase [Calditrichota bacterium]